MTDYSGSATGAQIDEAVAKLLALIGTGLAGESLILTGGSIALANSRFLSMESAAGTARQVVAVTGADSLTLGNANFNTVLSGTGHLLPTGDLTLSAGDLTLSAGDLVIAAANIRGAGGAFGSTLSVDGSYNIYGSAGEGAIFAGKGSINDVFLGNASGQAALVVPTGSRNVSVPAGNVIIGTSGKGIDFSATSDAAGMTSELLDDYEEGTWTPTATIGASAVGITYSAQTGLYTKVGNKVSFTGRIVLTSKGGLTGSVLLLALPFTCGSGIGVTSIPWTQGAAVTAGSAISGYVPVSSTTMALTQYDVTTGSTLLDGSDILDAFQVIFGGHYFI
jgi:hypothetical protein